MTRQAKKCPSREAPFFLIFPMSGAAERRRSWFLIGTEELAVIPRSIKRLRGAAREFVQFARIVPPRSSCESEGGRPARVLTRTGWATVDFPPVELPQDTVDLLLFESFPLTVKGLFGSLTFFYRESNCIRHTKEKRPRSAGSGRWPRHGQSRLFRPEERPHWQGHRNRYRWGRHPRFPEIPRQHLPWAAQQPGDRRLPLRIKLSGTVDYPVRVENLRRRRHPLMVPASSPL
jgi:hypothetical protein